ncbi:MAG TPA: sugar transferase, partial [Candidatus Didemnitutus sp.]|nr:sugar transferase [Candidatus Didemnitutus sp.]
MPRQATNTLRETTLPLLLLAGDAAVTYVGVLAAYALRYASPLGHLGIDVPNAQLAEYRPLLLLGVGLLIGAFAQLGLYDSRLLLRRYQCLSLIVKGTAFWCLVYLGVSLVLKFNPPISRLFVVLAFVSVVGLLYLWRAAAYVVLTRTPLLGRVQRRTALLGWGESAHELARSFAADPVHPFACVGIVSLPGERSPTEDSRPALPTRAAGGATDRVPWLGTSGQLDEILARGGIDALIITRIDLPAGELERVVESCERAYVDWKIVPGSFEVFVSGLHLQTIGKLPLLGVEGLAITKLFNRLLKRTVDVAGALVGLVVAAPFIAVLAALIKRESPGGGVFFAQTRVGADHEPFTLYKLRSMAPDAAARDHLQQSTARNDPRLLRIGAFMRRWNLDELPQFWNVLRGSMSLVGPRPERPV